MKTIKQIVHERRLARLAVLYGHDGHDGHDGSTATARIQRIDDRMNGIETIKKMNDDAVERQTEQIDDVNERIRASHDQHTASEREDGPQCGHDICERLYTIEKKTDPAKVAAIKDAADVDPILSMALMLINVLDHDEVDLANGMMSQIMDVNPLAGLAVLANISQITNE